MEAQRVYAIYYEGKFVCKIYAHTKYEAIEKVHSRMSQIHPGTERQKYCTKVVNV